jgi:alkylated DNA repair dioxygenase AlkB
MESKASDMITITFGDAAENHAGMEMIGSLGAKGSGFTKADMELMKANFEAKGTLCQMYELASIRSSTGIAFSEPAYVLVIKKAIESKPVFEELLALEMDKKALMRGRVVNKHARWNLCFDDVGHEADYEKGKGRVVAYSDVPLLKRIKKELPAMFGSKANELKAELNYYYDITKCGIGWHGDSERRKVIALRLGASLPIYFQWYYDSERVGERYEIPLDDGDMYVMSEKAVGTDWKCSSQFTLRHATGCDKYTE